jgi:hypothetical protein
MGTPFSAPARNLLIGAACGFAVIGAFSGGRALLTSEPPRPAEWLTPADREDLAAAIASVPAEAWAAGCLWEQRDRTDIVRVVSEPDGVVELWSARARSGRDMSLLTVDGVARPGEFSEVTGPGYYCNVPRE